MSDKIQSIIKGALIALAGGGVAALTQYLSGIDWGVFGIWASVVASIVINAIRKWLQDHPVPPAPPAPPAA